MKLLFPLFLSLFSVSIVQAEGITIPTGTGLPDPSGGIMGVLTNFTSWLLTIFLILAVLAFVITGLMYLFSMGDARSQNVENAKQYFHYSIIAIAIVGGSYIIIQSIDWFLQGIL
ncbi:MAG: hypothetical protein KAQ63_00015 [Candidatus Moranbacteria bacterium]|nr:hypothetical protein [Candidatus Moranbacteria bacterium]